MIVIINETMAKQYFDAKDPIGSRIQTGDPNPSSPWETIVGVVADVKLLRTGLSIRASYLCSL